MCVRRVRSVRHIGVFLKISAFRRIGGSMSIVPPVIRATDKVVRSSQIRAKGGDSAPFPDEKSLDRGVTRAGRGKSRQARAIPHAQGDSPRPRSGRSPIDERVATEAPARQYDGRLMIPVQITFPPELPVSQRRDDIARAIRENQVVIVAGETGSGKTTQLPKICLELGRESHRAHPAAPDRRPHHRRAHRRGARPGGRRARRLPGALHRPGRRRTPGSS